MADIENGGKASLRDLLGMQTLMYAELRKVQDEITKLYWKLGVLTGTVSLVTSLITTIIFHMVRG